MPLLRALNEVSQSKLPSFIDYVLAQHFACLVSAGRGLHLEAMKGIAWAFDPSQTIFEYLHGTDKLHLAAHSQAAGTDWVIDTLLKLAAVKVFPECSLPAIKPIIHELDLINDGLKQKTLTKETIRYSKSLISLIGDKKFLNQLNTTIQSPEYSLKLQAQYYLALHTDPNFYAAELKSFKSNTKAVCQQSPFDEQSLQEDARFQEKLTELKCLLTSMQDLSSLPAHLSIQSSGPELSFQSFPTHRLIGEQQNKANAELKTTEYNQPLHFRSPCNDPVAQQTAPAAPLPMQPSSLSLQAQNSSAQAMPLSQSFHSDVSQPSLSEGLEPINSILDEFCHLLYADKKNGNMANKKALKDLLFQQLQQFWNDYLKASQYLDTAIDTANAVLDQLKNIETKFSSGNVAAKSWTHEILEQLKKLNGQEVIQDEDHKDHKAAFQRISLLDNHDSPIQLSKEDLTKESSILTNMLTKNSGQFNSRVAALVEEFNRYYKNQTNHLLNIGLQHIVKKSFLSISTPANTPIDSLSQVSTQWLQANTKLQDFSSIGNQIDQLCQAVIAQPQYALPDIDTQFFESLQDNLFLLKELRIIFAGTETWMKAGTLMEATYEDHSLSATLLTALQRPVVNLVFKKMSSLLFLENNFTNNQIILNNLLDNLSTSSLSPEYTARPSGTVSHTRNHQTMLKFKNETAITTSSSQLSPPEEQKQEQEQIQISYQEGLNQQERERQRSVRAEVAEALRIEAQLKRSQKKISRKKKLKSFQMDHSIPSTPNQTLGKETLPLLPQEKLHLTLSLSLKKRLGDISEGLELGPELLLEFFNSCAFGIFLRGLMAYTNKHKKALANKAAYDYINFYERELIRLGIRTKTDDDEELGINLEFTSPDAFSIDNFSIDNFSIDKLYENAPQWWRQEISQSTAEEANNHSEQIQISASPLNEQFFLDHFIAARHIFLNKHPAVITALPMDNDDERRSLLANIHKRLEEKDIFIYIAELFIANLEQALKLKRENYQPSFFGQFKDSAISLATKGAKGLFQNKAFKIISEKIFQKFGIYVDPKLIEGVISEPLNVHSYADELSHFIYENFNLDINSQDFIALKEDQNLVPKIIGSLRAMLARYNIYDLREFLVKHLALDLSSIDDEVIKHALTDDQAFSEFLKSAFGLTLDAKTLSELIDSTRSLQEFKACFRAKFQNMSIIKHVAEVSHSSLKKREKRAEWLSQIIEKYSKGMMQLNAFDIQLALLSRENFSEFLAFNFGIIFSADSVKMIIEAMEEKPKPIPATAVSIIGNPPESEIQPTTQFDDFQKVASEIITTELLKQKPLSMIRHFFANRPAIERCEKLSQLLNIHVEPTELHRNLQTDHDAALFLERSFQKIIPGVFKACDFEGLLNENIEKFIDVTFVARKIAATAVKLFNYQCSLNFDFTDIEIDLKLFIEYVSELYQSRKPENHPSNEHAPVSPTLPQDSNQDIEAPWLDETWLNGKVLTGLPRFKDEIYKKIDNHLIQIAATIQQYLESKKASVNEEDFPRPANHILNELREISTSNLQILMRGEALIQAYNESKILSADLYTDLPTLQALREQLHNTITTYHQDKVTHSQWATHVLQEFCAYAKQDPQLTILAQPLENLLSLRQKNLLIQAASDFTSRMFNDSFVVPFISRIEKAISATAIYTHNTADIDQKTAWVWKLGARFLFNNLSLRDTEKLQKNIAGLKNNLIPLEKPKTWPQYFMALILRSCRLGLRALSRPLAFSNAVARLVSYFLVYNWHRLLAAGLAYAATGKARSYLLPKILPSILPKIKAMFKKNYAKKYAKEIKAYSPHAIYILSPIFYGIFSRIIKSISESMGVNLFLKNSQRHYFPEPLSPAYRRLYDYLESSSLIQERPSHPSTNSSGTASMDSFALLYQHQRKATRLPAIREMAESEMTATPPPSAMTGFHKP